jgi:hypothetical protein
LAKGTPITDAELLGAIDASEAQAQGNFSDQVASDRADAIARYYGQPYGNEKPDRSSVISRDVADVMEGVTANVIKPFVGGDQVVQFEPVGPEDETAASQETDYINFIALERNNGFMWLASAIKDALLLRTGYVKCQWTVRQDVISETYAGQNEQEIALLLQDKDVEVVQHSEYPDPYAPTVDPQTGQPLPPQMLHDVKVRRARPTEYVELCPIPPDEVLVSERATGPSLQDVEFVQHRTHKTLSQLREAGYKVDDDITDNATGETVEDYARDRFGYGDEFNDPTNDPSRRIVLFKESYINVDRDGDGIAEKRRVCTVGTTLLSDDEADVVGIASFSGIIVPHQHLGMSVYDLVEDIAKIKTSLMRSYLDNRMLQNNGRWGVDVQRTNMDDFLVSRPGGAIRVEGDPNTAVVPYITPDTSSGALQGLEYLDSVRENRSGYTRNSAGIDNDALTNNTATGMKMQLSQSQLRLEMIARTIAETGVRDVFRIVHALTLKHSSQEDRVRLKGKWAVVNPREWIKRSDLSISIGLGTGTQDQQLAKLIGLGPMMQQMQMLGLVGVTEGYNYGAEVLKLTGYKSPDKFIHAPVTDPQTGQPKEPSPQPPPPVQVAQIQQQGKQAELQATMQADVQKFHAQQQSEAQRAAADAQLKREEMQMQAAAKQQEQQNALQVQASNDARDNAKAELEHQREMQRMAMEDAFKRDQMAEEFRFKAWEAELKAKTTTEAAVAGAKPHNDMAAMIKHMSSPKRAVKGADGSWTVQHLTGNA